MELTKAQKTRMMFEQKLKEKQEMELKIGIPVYKPGRPVLPVFESYMQGEY